MENVEFDFHEIFILLALVIKLKGRTVKKNRKGKIFLSPFPPAGNFGNYPFQHRGEYLSEKCSPFWLQFSKREAETDVVLEEKHGSKIMVLFNGGE